MEKLQYVLSPLAVSLSLKFFNAVTKKDLAAHD